ncbi:methylthioribulose 1-phosphate dehydratase [Alicyclobacillus sp. TC]|uniref:Methylthioribulose-1-phosphate dehydratase n=1 Tax=Alicyclobacillus tolerans TaxID=90970 RepID=A0A1M6PMA0_9BACL|nr:MULTISPECIES: methylthioribulose 1-phosphate dehydratase [Alicyclobacillus]QRF22310.1 methylthioribulose 1-phosphate dehydratase [Alicyclobacillus sp. TC]SHK09051.1 methylthioribulose-1-phosphate dehydratase [Alicyclobacillus montanus]
MYPFNQAVESLLEIAHRCAQKGWLPATSGNLSVRLNGHPLSMAITRSGCDKACLKTEDIIVVDERMQVMSGYAGKPSAETSVHVGLYEKFPDIACILHVHTIFNNLLSERYFSISEGTGHISFAQHELLKALGHWEEKASINIPIVPNYANLERLGQAVTEAAYRDVPGVLVHRHGIYAYGESPEAALRHLEAFEFLFEYHWRLNQAASS